MTIIKERKLVPNKDGSLLDKHYNLFQYWNDLLKLANMSTLSLGKYQRSLLFYLTFLRVFLPWWHQGKIPGRRKYLRYLVYVKRKTDFGLRCGSNLVSTSDYAVCGKWQNLLLNSELVSFFHNKMFLFYLFTIWLFPVLSPPFLCSSLFFIPTYVSSFIYCYAP